MQMKIEDNLKEEFQKVLTEDDEVKEIEDKNEAFIRQRMIENANEEGKGSI